MKLEEAKKYVNRIGETVGPLEKHGNEYWCFRVGRTYYTLWGEYCRSNENGIACRDESRDIVAEADEPTARQEGETPSDERFATIFADLDGIHSSQEGWPTYASQMALRSIHTELSAKQAEVEGLKSSLRRIADEPDLEDIVGYFEKLAEEHQKLSGSCEHMDVQIVRLKFDLESLRAAQGWRPISEAPLNKRVMVWFPYWGHEPFVAVKNVNGWFSEQILSDSGKEPIGWMPLPTPPVERSGE